MKPVEFEQQTHKMVVDPNGKTEEEMGMMPAHIDYVNHQTISCWELTPEEIETVKETGRIWLAVHAIPPPPVAMCTHVPFNKVKKIESINIKQIDKE